MSSWISLQPSLCAVGLDAQQLLLVVPLVERLGLVEALVALQADEPGAGHLGHGLGQLGLAGAGRPLDEHRLAEPVGQEHHAGDAVVGQVGHVVQLLAHGGDGVEALSVRRRGSGGHGGQPYRPP